MASFPLKSVDDMVDFLLMSSSKTAESWITCWLDFELNNEDLTTPFMLPAGGPRSPLFIHLSLDYMNPTSPILVF